MSEIYENWERLVGRVIRREKDRELCYRSSISSEASSSSDSISSPPWHHHALTAVSVSPQPPTPPGHKKIVLVFRVDIGNVQTMKGADFLRLIGICFAPYVRLAQPRNYHFILKRLCSIQGVDSVSLDRKEDKLTVIGLLDPVAVVYKLRKLCFAEIVSVGPYYYDQLQRPMDPNAYQH